jgi:hypothetical protein
VKKESTMNMWNLDTPDNNNAIAIPSSELPKNTIKKLPTELKICPGS